MTYATYLIENYRLALRDLWNKHLRPPHVAADRDSVRDLDSLKLPLFRTLVLRRLDPKDTSPLRIFGDRFRVVAQQDSGVLGPILPLGAGVDGRQMSAVHGPFAPGELSLALLDFFDWDQTGRRDFRYYRVRVDRCDQQPHLVRHEAIVDVLTSDVLWEDADATAERES